MLHTYYELDILWYMYIYWFNWVTVYLQLTVQFLFDFQIGSVDNVQEQQKDLYWMIH